MRIIRKLLAAGYGVTIDLESDGVTFISVWSTHKPCYGLRVEIRGSADPDAAMQSALASLATLAGVPA